MRILTTACLSLLLGVIAGCYSASRDPAASAADMAKIDPGLAAAADDLAHGMPTAARTDAQGQLLVYVYVTDTGAATLGQVTNAGLEHGQPSSGVGVIQGWVAPKDLKALAELTCVRRITLPLYASPR